ncbi:uncharacterized protein LOC120425049 isoform X2 [Culex pipiens pallens]|uniref:uncharacterized protein LOC120425049 isoform X2 n=1 Tax=Culex pipiens pallens TaxID=42434 RepID=UPI001954B100|nr:uncharacterized protein LOC120425049 isoform X2 [Culex pipiens pallens]
MEGVPDQTILDAGQNQQTADVQQAPLAAGQQLYPPFLQSSPPHAAPYVEWFQHQRGYVAQLFRQQQEALQRQLTEMQQQQLAFIQHQQQFISSIVTSMKVQAQPCLDSLGSGNAEEFETDPDGDGVSTAWHNQHEELLQEKKVHSLDKLAEVLLCGNDGGDEEVFEQQVLVESCARGYRDDVTEYVFEVSNSTTVTPLHSPPDPWPKPTGSWMGESVEFAGLTEDPLWFVANVNTSQQLHSAVIDQVSKSTATAFRSARQPRIAVGAPPPGEKYGERILSKLEFETPPQIATTLPVRQIGCYGLEKRLKVIDYRMASRKYPKLSAVSESTASSRFGTLKQPTWSLGRPPEKPRIGGTVLSTFVSLTTSTTATPSQSVAC